MYTKLFKSLFMPFIRFGIAGEEEEGTVGTGNEQRLALLSRISDNADEERKGEFEQYDDDGNLITDPELETESATTTEEISTETDETPLTDPVKRYKIKVNGVEKELTEEEMIAQVQKVASADQYIQEAAQLHREAEQRVKGLTTPKEEAPKEQKEDDDIEIARAIQMGSEEEALAAIRKLRSPKGPSTDDLSKMVDERLNFQSAAQWFATEYKDIVSNPFLYQLAVNQDNALRAQGDNRPYRERYAEIGDSVRGLVEGLVKERAPTTTTTTATEESTTAGKQRMTEKQNRKAAAPSVPKPAAGKVEEPVEEEVEESASDIIGKMAQHRGGPQWMRG